MSKYEQKPGDIIIFKNTYKEKDSHPDYKGTGLSMDGNTIEIALWVKEGAKGKFFAGRIQDAMPKTESKPAEEPETLNPDGSDLPF